MQIRTELEARKTRTKNRFAKYQADPVGFIEKETFGHVWSKQREICESVRDYRFTAVKACHGPGKTAIAARIACWWLSVWPAGEAMVVSTAPTGHQVKTLLWREIGKVHRAAGLPGRTNQTNWIMPPNEIVGFGVSVRETDPTRFQGIHSPHLLVLIDEGCGVTTAIFNAAETLVTNADSRFLVIGNPDDPSTQFAVVCRPGSGYNVITISAFATPNFTNEPIPEWLAKMLVDKVWVAEREKRWGKTSPMYISKVLGEFPDVASDGLIPLGKLQEAINREVPADATWPNELGIDCARYGDDKSTFYHRRGIAGRRVHEHRNRALTEIAGKAIIIANMLKVDAIKIDDVGLGGGVTDMLYEAHFLGKIKAKVVPIIGGERRSMTADDQERFNNLRSKLHWDMRERFIGDRISLLPAVDLINQADPDAEDYIIEAGLDDLLAQAGAIKYKVVSTGQIYVESKDDMKKAPRSLPSPDDFDGLVLAFAPSDIGGEMVLPFQAIEVREETPPRVPQFWPQVVVIHIERQTFAAVWGAYQEHADTIHITGEYVAPLGEIPKHVEAILLRCSFRIPAVFALKTEERPKKVGIDMAYRMQAMHLPILTVDESSLDTGIAEMHSRMQTQRLKVYDTCPGWFAELARFRRNAQGELLDGHVPLMHATALLVQSGMQAGSSEAQNQSDEDALERDARAFGESRSETGY